MWHTSEGERTLEGAEAILVKASASRMAEICLEERDSSRTYWYGIEIFDALHVDDRLRIVEVVTTWLLTPSNRPLPLSAVLEATVGAIFAQVRLELEAEIDAENDVASDSGFDPADEKSYDSWRTEVFASLNERRLASMEFNDSDDGGIPWYPESADWRDMEQWVNALEFLADQILWDRDYELASALLDKPPEVATAIKNVLGIDDEYFVDPGPNDVASLDHWDVLKRFQAIGTRRDV